MEPELIGRKGEAAGAFPPLCIGDTVLTRPKLTPPEFVQPIVIDAEVVT